MTALRLPLLLSLALVSACAQKPTSVSLQQNQQDKCPMTLSRGQQLILNMPSNPTTGFRWLVRDAAANVLQSLGPEVYSNPEDAGLVGSAGRSTWRFQAKQTGEGRLLLTYERPWEVGVAPARRFDCAIRVE